MLKRSIYLILIAIPCILFGYQFWPEEKLPPKVRADAIRVTKHQRELTLFRKEKPLKTYRISLGREPVGHKQQQGDCRTPEGHYVIDYRNPKSRYYLSLHISYPSARDKEGARRRNVNPGSAIMIHGLPNSLGWVGRWHRLVDWTHGCIAVTNNKMDEIWRSVPNGTPIEILP